ncbi:MAG: hypothetical protein ACXACX_14155 [Candidatus Hodarchaeales archaeon]|jgi:predicted regulator of Ras-like GTPase activity (Roadblock/LC7/MglB family)
MFNPKDFENVLTKVLKADQGIKKAILVDRTGLTGLNIVTSEFDTGKIFAVSTGRGVLCVITDPSINLGIIRLVMKRASKDLAEKLDTFLASQGSMIGSSTDVSIDAISSSSSSGPGTPSISPMNKDELEAALKELERF